MNLTGPDWHPSASLATLRQRAGCLRRVRDFFQARGLLEVETPVLQSGANLDPGIAPIPAAGRYLVTSPEHFLKRLLAAGGPDCWSLGPVARAGELGRWHGPEFRLLEWYRLGWDEQQLADETMLLLDAITGLGARSVRLSYADAFRACFGWDPASVADAELRRAAQAAGLEQPAERQELLDLLLATVVQPGFAADAWTVLIDWPPEQAAQAQLRRDGHGRMVAARFEIYRGGLELANGYGECTNRQELAARQAPLAAQHRWPADERYYAALDHGLPPCAGVAVGFDRAVALACGASELAAVQAFAWNRA